MSEVPAGQAPRDAKFWATYYAVNAELAHATATLRCEEEGHEIKFGHGEDPECLNCGLKGEKLLISAGYVREGDSWVWRDAH